MIPSLRLLRLFAALSLTVCTVSAAEVPAADGIYAVIETSKGPLVCELFFREAPLTSMNFIGLAEGTIGNSFRKPGEPFFDGLNFHRVVKDFVVQGGDPKGDGEGGPGYAFTDEFSPRLRHDRAGMLSMANDGPNTNGSQFFITLRDTNRLNYLHSVFGRVVSGEDVLQRIEQGDKIENVKIVRVGDAAKKFQTDVIMFEIYKKRALLLPDPVLPADFKYFVDETGTLPEFRVKNFNFKLANYAKFRRERIVVRLFANAKSSDADLPALAKQLDRGRLAGRADLLLRGGRHVENRRRPAAERCAGAWKISGPCGNWCAAGRPPGALARTDRGEEAQGGGRCGHRHRDDAIG